jgi:hypothetical protein
MKKIEALIVDGGEITAGAFPPHECAATAADGSNAFAMLARRGGETINALLERLDRAISACYGDGETVDEVAGH